MKLQVIFKSRLVEGFEISFEPIDQVKYLLDRPQYRISKNNYEQSILRTCANQKELVDAIIFYVFEMHYDIKIEKLI